MTMQATIPQMPGLTAGELTAMQAAAARLLDGADPALAALTRAGLAELGRPAGHGAAGTASANRDIYQRQGGAHHMTMGAP